MDSTWAKADYRKRSKLFVVKALHFLITVGLFYAAWIYFRYHEIPFEKEAGFRYNYYI